MRSRPRPTRARRRPRASRRRRPPCAAGSPRPRGAPCRGRSRTARARRRRPRRPRRCAPSSSIDAPSPKPPPAPFSSTSTTPGAASSEDRRRRAGRRARRDPGRRAVAPVRPDVQVEEPRPVRWATRSSLASTSTERRARSGSGPARFTRYGAWIASGAMPCSASRSRNAGELDRQTRRRCHEVGLSVKTWSADAPISAARSAAFTMPCPSGRCAPSRRPFGSIGRRVAERAGRR